MELLARSVRGLASPKNHFGVAFDINDIEWNKITAQLRIKLPFCWLRDNWKTA